MKCRNKVELLGYVTGQPELKKTSEGQVVTFDLATNFSYKDKDGNDKQKAEFHRIVAWNGWAEVARKYLSKGSRVFLEGYLKTQSWVDEKSAFKRYRTQVVVTDIYLLDSKPSNEQTEPISSPQAND